MLIISWILIGTYFNENMKQIGNGRWQQRGLSKMNLFTPYAIIWVFSLQLIISHIVWFHKQELNVYITSKIWGKSSIYNSDSAATTSAISSYKLSHTNTPSAPRESTQETTIDSKTSMSSSMNKQIPPTALDRYWLICSQGR